MISSTDGPAFINRERGGGIGNAGTDIIALDQRNWAVPSRAELQL